jgi:fatty acid desaturase
MAIRKTYGRLPQILEEPAMFKTNEGTIDRVLRVFVGLALIAIVFVGPQTPWGWVGLVPLLTGLVGTCPLYTVLGIRTCKLKS